jgi:hypothetical protein
MTWREQARHELASTTTVGRVVLGLLWIGSIVMGFYLVGIVAAPSSGLAMIVLAILVTLVPGLLLVSLTLKVGYAVAKAKWPQAVGVFELAVGRAFVAVIAVAFVAAAWEDRQKAVAFATGLGSLVAVLFAGMYSLTAGAFEAMTSLRGLLVIIAILLYQIVRRLDDRGRRN